MCSLLAPRLCLLWAAALPVLGSRAPQRPSPWHREGSPAECGEKRGEVNPRRASGFQY